MSAYKHLPEEAAEIAAAQGWDDETLVVHLMACFERFGDFEWREGMRLYFAQAAKEESEDEEENIETIEVTDAAVGAKPKWSGYTIDAEAIHEYMPHTLRPGDKVVLPHIYGWRLPDCKRTGPIWEFCWTATKETSLMNGIFIIMDAYNRKCDRNKCEPRQVFLEGAAIFNGPSGRVFTLHYGT